jgi:ABC-2 type transport system permease protein
LPHQEHQLEILLLVFLLIVSIFKGGVASDLPIVVVDYDNSKLSRSILQNIDATSEMEIKYVKNSTKDALDLVKSGKAYALIIIPKYFFKDTLLKKNPTVTAMLNTQYILIGKILTAKLTKVTMHSSAEVEYVNALVNTQNSETALKSVAPIGMQITPFFNTYKNYYYFLVSALLPAIWQVFIVIATLVGMGEIFKFNKQREFFENSEYIGAKLLGFMMPYTIAFMILGMLFTFYLYSEWAFNGSFTVLFLAMFFTTIAYQVIALLIFSTKFNYADSLSLGSVYTAPAFAFLGVTFPIYSMNDFALMWRDILPVSHYIQVQISQANYGNGALVELDKLGTILMFWLLFIPVLWLFKRKISKVLV